MRSDFPARVRAVLGPTNTGKTHLAMERLLAHSSGMIGFPLRLLARENYDKMVARKGARDVALITGEEKIVPPGARWFSCTVEAMPLDRPTEFLAVDEIQLCADPDRGHVFTERLLAARGMVETMFLGAETIRPLLSRLVPGVEIETRPRLSQLSCVGVTKLIRLPPRSAVVAFSAAELYAIAEMIRRRRGGCAVVMGRLSPRTRNAQVALYQEKEVDFLVATDAIGMGLNMDVDHVGFAGLSKFDGHRPRPLVAPELAQIAGRAGRGARDGTFGTTALCPPLDPDQIEAIENHRFEPIQALVWRNDELDFSHLDLLIESLEAPPSRPGLTRGPNATDVETLAALARQAEVRDLARGTSRTKLLWQVCQIPDFRKLADDSHTRLAAEIYGHLARQTKLPTDLIARNIEHLNRTDGDIDTLMQRLAGMRVWSYIAARGDWIADSAHWQGRARAVEDLLSDALHERLTARFVDRRSALLIRRLDNQDGEQLLSAVTSRGEVVVEGHSVGQIAGFAFSPDPQTAGDERRLVMRAARRALLSEMPRRLARFAACEDSELVWRADHMICWQGAPVARLRAGVSLLAPRVEVLANDQLTPHDLARIRDRCQDFVQRRIETDLGPLFVALRHEAARPLRGPLHLLMEAGGVRPHAPDDAPIAAATHLALGAIQVTAGRFALFHPAMLKPTGLLRRAALLAIALGLPATPGLPGPGLAHLAPPPDWTAGFAENLGYLPIGPKLVRLDIAERIASELFAQNRDHPWPVPRDLSARLGVKQTELASALRALGLRLIEPVAVPYGPPAPMMHARLRQPALKPGFTPKPDHPFAALKLLAG